MIKLNKKMQNLFNNKGFTLIEMAIVLIIIGIIIGAIVKGKDLIKSSEQKKIYTKFVSAWAISYAQFYDRTGKRLGDFWDAAGAAQGQDSRCDTSLTAVPPVPLDYVELVTTTVATHYGLTDLGLTPPTTNGANEYTYKYIDSAGTGYDMTIGFKYDAVANYNYMWINNLPNELGIALDTMIDGSADGLAATGKDFLCYTVDADAGNANWGAATTAVSARWKMDF